MRYKRIGYNLNVMRHAACLDINPITVDDYAHTFQPDSFSTLWAFSTVANVSIDMI